MTKRLALVLPVAGALALVAAGAMAAEMPDDVAALVKKRLYKQRFTIAGARKRIRDLLREEREGVAAPDPVARVSSHIQRVNTW